MPIKRSNLKDRIAWGIERTMAKESDIMGAGIDDFIFQLGKVWENGPYTSQKSTIICPSNLNGAVREKGLLIAGTE